MLLMLFDGKQACFIFVWELIYHLHLRAHFSPLSFFIFIFHLFGVEIWFHLCPSFIVKACSFVIRNGTKDATIQFLAVVSSDELKFQKSMVLNALESLKSSKLGDSNSKMFPNESNTVWFLEAFCYNNLMVGKSRLQKPSTKKLVVVVEGVKEVEVELSKELDDPWVY